MTTLTLPNPDPTDALYTKIEADFPGLSGGLDAALSAWAVLQIKNITLPWTLFFVGPPSSDKTTILNIMKVAPVAYYLDDFTPAAFVSHMSGMSEAQLAKNDLLPKLKNKLLLTPELNTTFSQNKDKLVANMGILTRVLDGQGLVTQSGVHGKRGYDEPIMFTWLGATTPIRKIVWELMGKMGSRLYFYNVEANSMDRTRTIALLRSPITHNNKIARCRAAVADFMAELKNKNPSGVNWDPAQDDEDLQGSIWPYAELLAGLRGDVELLYDKKGNSEVGPATIERSDRAATMLYNLARGRALIHGRTQIIQEDPKLVSTIAHSSAPYYRVKAFRIIAKNKTMTIESFAAELRVTHKPAIKIARILAALGLVNLGYEPQAEPGRPPIAIMLDNRFDNLP